MEKSYKWAPPREIYHFPANAFVASFVGETNFINGKIRSLSNGSAEIETPVGALHSESVYHDFAIGEEAICSIRPETINVAEKIPTTAPNQHRAKVLDATYLGARRGISAFNCRGCQNQSRSPQPQPPWQTDG